MNDTILPIDWQNILKPEFEKTYFKKLTNFVDKEFIENTCYPKKENIFKAFNDCSFDALKVVIIGQDPYHGIGQGNGLCFSVNQGVKHPPSLVNIFKELATDLQVSTPVSGDLSHWATQGVLLLNATLTVREGEAGSHQKQGWEQFTDAVIQKISEEKQGVVFLLWGKFAEKKGSIINTEKHPIFKAPHPSPLGAWRGWFGSKHFSKTNTFLKSVNQNPIKW
ncbi:uracil-DNA glycosylase [Tenacibaculum finnmarkense]|uniref:Uracil-DNA glycosylase n=1 Tax=Tenacibaculum finnmarkense genomovar finnmarkense TaxID=1458503 RepID=A0AAP1RGP2_9FLAO|nr:uracil-DNA glycosylase [Tenacibaculum finnmarkense]MBE7653429.1 uracil-DNA glycosylase [Tenacibaculum finnmarkense genomovar finnmarkense]MBE7695717.1 uracil-DNA glycosylase [Tenacibaculum finnmarkense genomovar finnmarkense]MCD8427982.1 uracil-DNA glycosylase [Tenacibaculum finnmarkense genomovar finnmarkense]MCG8731659.1 uracil-DNA glycosylase [Tenacibaculum finnmarkense]MCG8752215.1 uracil-DNA glycosylase [Tenacibaculum finnmarkense]